MTFSTRNKTIVPALFMLLLTLGLFSCQKNLDYFVADENALNAPDTVWYNNVTADMPVSLLKNELRYAYTRQNSNLQGGAVNHISLGSGLNVDIPAGALTDSSGQPYLGAMQVESVLLRTKGDYIRMGLSDISFGHQMIHGGSYYLNFYNNSGQRLWVNQNTSVDVSFQSPLPYSSDMKIFKGQINGQDGNNWELANPSNVLNQSGGVYHTSVNELSWISCSYVPDLSSTEQTRVALSLPSNYTNANTIAFIVYDQLESVLALGPNQTQRKFTSVDIAKNEPAKIIVLSKQGGQYFLGYADIVTQNAGQSGFQEISIVPTITTLDNMKNYIGTL